MFDRLDIGLWHISTAQDLEGSPSTLKGFQGVCSVDTLVGDGIDIGIVEAPTTKYGWDTISGLAKRHA